MAKQKKNPFIAAILNFLLWGLGYVYNGKRMALGIGLILGSLLWSVFFVYVMSTPLPESSTPASPTPFSIIPFLPFLGNLIITIALAYDAYREAKQINKQK
jgi:hypothetical protein